MITTWNVVDDIMGEVRHKSSNSARTFGFELPPVPTPVDFALSLGFTPNPHQAEVLNAIVPRGILNCSRQWGKSTVTATKAVHRAYHHPGSLVLVVAPSGRQSATFVEKASQFLHKLNIKPRGDGHNDISLKFPNGSRIIGIPAVDATIRGYSGVSLLIIDEASRVDDKIYHTVRPMLAATELTNSHPGFPVTPELWLISTPFGCRGFFYEEFRRYDSNPPWTRFTFPASQCPHISPAFLEEERATMPGPEFRQEYECEFVREGNNSFFRYQDLEFALTDKFHPIFPNLTIDSWIARGRPPR